MTDLQRFLGWVRHDLELFSSYAKKRWSWLWGDEEAQAALLPVVDAGGQGGLGGVEFLLAREWACLFEVGWPTATPESENEYLERESVWHAGD